jgi:hypothetical protein
VRVFLFLHHVHGESLVEQGIVDDSFPTKRFFGRHVLKPMSPKNLKDDNFALISSVA